ncbi:hypothetical protein ACN47E_005053 [Coniothyrium glycines]
MSQRQQQSQSQQINLSRVEQSRTDKESSPTRSDDWSDVTDPNERRKIQNKLAQRRFRDKVKEQREETQLDLQNRQRAGGSYATPEPEAIDTNRTLSGLPWGGISMKHIVEKGKTRAQISQRSSREGSVAEGSTRTAGSRLGLHLTDRFARGTPGWKYLPFYPYQHLRNSTRWN